MKVVIFISLMLTIMFVGCTHNSTVRLRSSVDYALWNKRTLRKQPVVTLMDGQKHTANNLRFDPDSTSWVDPNTQRVIAVPTAEVSNVRIVSFGKGALEGLGLGLSIGALTGGLIGTTTSGDTGSGIQYSTGSRIGIAATGLGLIGGLIGLIIGSAKGSKDVYHIEHESPQDKIGLEIVKRDNVYFTRLNYKF